MNPRLSYAILLPLDRGINSTQEAPHLLHSPQRKIQQWAIRVLPDSLNLRDSFQVKHRRRNGMVKAYCEFVEKSSSPEYSCPL